MTSFKNYEEAIVYADGGRLPVGGYVVKILDVKIEDGVNGYNDKLVLSFDIAEGEYKDFYKHNYSQQRYGDKKWKGTARISIPFDNGIKEDMLTMNRFKTMIKRFEESNDMFHWDWDETKLKGKLVGAIFNNKEYKIKDKHGFFTNFHTFTTVENIKEKRFKIPPDTLLKESSTNHAITQDKNGFVEVPSDLEEELPFN